MNSPVSPWVRVAILLAATAILGFISHRLTGSVLPIDAKEALVFQNALLLIVLGSALLEHHYTKPADSVINSLMGLLTLLTVYGEAPKWPWRLVVGYCLLVFFFSTICVTVSSTSRETGWRAKLAQFTYRPSVILGSSRVLFTVVFLSGIFCKKSQLSKYVKGCQMGQAFDFHVTASC